MLITYKLQKPNFSFNFPENAPYTLYDLEIDRSLHVAEFQTRSC